MVTIRRGSSDETIAVNRVACDYGLAPNATLALAIGCALDANHAICIDDMQPTSLDDIYAAGECTGIGGMELARVEGALAGKAALGLPRDDTLIRERTKWRAFAQRIGHAFALDDAATKMPPLETIPLPLRRRHAWRGRFPHKLTRRKI